MNNYQIQIFGRNVKNMFNDLDRETWLCEGITGPQKRVMIPYTTMRAIRDPLSLVDARDMIDYLEKYWPRLWTNACKNEKTIVAALQKIADCFGVLFLVYLDSSVSEYDEFRSDGSEFEWKSLKEEMEKQRKYMVFASIEEGI